MNIFEWIAYGVERGWVTEACATHDGVPSTPEEHDLLWEGESDPCQHVLRLWPEPVVADRNEWRGHALPS
jgi:hypothetical protein